MDRSGAERQAGKNANASFKLISGMNHVLKNSSLEWNKNIATYSNATLPPLNEKLTKGVLLFVTNINNK